MNYHPEATVVDTAPSYSYVEILICLIILAVAGWMQWNAQASYDALPEETKPPLIMSDR